MKDKVIRKSNKAEIANKTIFLIISFLIICFLSFVLVDFFIKKFNGADELIVAGVGLVCVVFSIPICGFLVPWGVYLLITKKKNFFILVSLIALIILWFLSFLFTYIIPY